LEILRHKEAGLRRIEFLFGEDRNDREATADLRSNVHFQVGFGRQIKLRSRSESNKAQLASPNDFIPLAHPADNPAGNQPRDLTDGDPPIRAAHINPIAFVDLAAFRIERVQEFALHIIQPLDEAVAWRAIDVAIEHRQENRNSMAGNGSALVVAIRLDGDDFAIRRADDGVRSIGDASPGITKEGEDGKTAQADWNPNNPKPMAKDQAQDYPKNEQRYDEDHRVRIERNGSFGVSFVIFCQVIHFPAFANLGREAECGRPLIAAQSQTKDSIPKSKSEPAKRGTVGGFPGDAERHQIPSLFLNSSNAGC